MEIFVRGLCIEARIGINPEERETPQPVVIDVRLRAKRGKPPSEVAFVPAHGNDDASRSVVCYDALSGRSRSGKRRHWPLRRSGRAPRAGLLTDERVQEARVAVAKPSAIADADSAGVAVQLDRTDG